MKTSKKEAKLIELAISGINEVANEEELSSVLENHWKVIDSGSLKGRTITGGYCNTTRISSKLTLLQTTVFGPQHYGRTRLYLVKMQSAKVSEMLDACWMVHTHHANSANEASDAPAEADASEN